MPQPLEIQVLCYAGYRGEQTPERFVIGQREVEVTDIIDRWIGPDHRYFKLRGDDEAIYILRFDEGNATWALTLFDCGKSQATRLSST